MAEGWVETAGGRHHGAHAAFAAQGLGMDAKSFLDFSQNINPLGPPPGALEAAREAISGCHVYPDSGYQDLRRALAGYLGVEAECVLPTNGGAEALFLAALGLSRSGARRAVVLDPTFSEYAAAANAAGLGVVRRQAWREAGGSFVLDSASLEELYESDMVFLCNPNNPTGTALPRDEVLETMSSVRDSGATLVVDEAFADFAPEVSVASEIGDDLLVARSFTKFFSMPGLRLGCLVTPRASGYAEMQPSWPVNVAAEASGIHAASDAEFSRRSVKLVSDLRGELSRSLQTVPGLRVYEGAANFLLVRGPAGIPERLARRGVLVRGCEPFEGLETEHFRVAVKEEKHNRRLIEALRDELSENA